MKFDLKICRLAHLFFGVKCTCLDLAPRQNFLMPRLSLQNTTTSIKRSMLCITQLPKGYLHSLIGESYRSATLCCRGLPRRIPFKLLVQETIRRSVEHCIPAYS